MFELNSNGRKQPMESLPKGKVQIKHLAMNYSTGWLDQIFRILKSKKNV